MDTLELYYKDNQIINKEFKEIKKFINSNKAKYICADPFAHIIIDNFFDDNFLNRILNEFPDLAVQRKTKNYSNLNEVKFGNNEYNDFPKNIKFLFNFLNSEFFLNFLQKITSIKEKLIADPELNGGGLHQIKNGGLLKIHSDFNRHPTLELDRRLNVLIYLNKNWDDDYGGHLEFWDKDMQFCKKKISPIFNRMVIFSTTDFSNHGHPDPLKCPESISRKSIATYYFSDGRPVHEINRMFSKNTTYFKDRAGIKNETYHRDGKLKRFLRSFNFYKGLKNIEKKFLRTGKSKNKRDIK